MLSHVENEKNAPNNTEAARIRAGNALAASRSEGPSEVEACIQQVPISSIQDSAMKTRVQTDKATIADYAERMSEGEKFPPVVAFNQGDSYFVGDGHHRVDAARSLGFQTIDCEVIGGTERDALLYALGSNVAHGLRRTNADKNLCVQIAIHDSEWGKYSDRKIASICGVSNTFVSNLRREVENGPSTVDSDASENPSGADDSVTKVRNRAIKHLVELRAILRTLHLNDECGSLVTQIKKRILST